MSSIILSAANFKKLSQIENQELNIDIDESSNHNGSTSLDDSSASLTSLANENSLKSKLNNSYKTLTMLNILRKNRQLCDVILQIDDNHNDIYCHQVILACNSKLFMELLLDTEIESKTDYENGYHNGHNGHTNGNGATNNHTNHNHTKSGFVTYNSSNRKVTIKLESYLKKVDYKLTEFTYDALKTCISYMYTFDVNFVLSNMALIKEIYCLSIQLNINSLTTRCSKFLIQNLNETNCLYIRTFALDQQLITSSTEFIKQYMSKIIYLNEFSQLPRINIDLVDCTTNFEDLNVLLLKWLIRQLLNSNDEKTMILNNLCENINVLYLNDDKSLHDCCDMDCEHKNYSEYINDYQKKGYHQYNQQLQQQQSIQEVNTTTDLLIENHQYFNEIISTYKTSDNNFIVLCIINGDLLTLSVHVQATNLTQNNDDNEVSNIMERSEKRLSVIDKPSNATPVSPLKTQFSLGGEVIQSNNVFTPEVEIATDEESKSLQRSVSQNSQGSQTGYQKLPKMSSTRCSHGLVAYNKKLYIIGGYDRGECLTKCETYDPIENKFTNFASLTNRRGRSATVYLPKLNSVFVFGGSDGHKELNSLEKFDFNTNKWSLIPFAVGFDCTNIGITCDDDLIYLVGIHADSTNKPIRSLKYDPTSNAFTCIGDLNSGRSQCALIRYKDFLYVFGGHDQIRCLNTCEVYNTKENTWNYIASMIEPRRGCGAAEKNGFVYIVGGTNGSSSLKSTEIYNTQTNRFTIGPELNVARANVSITFIGDYLFAVGGFDGKSFLKTIEYLNINDLNAGWSIYHKIDSNFI